MKTKFKLIGITALAAVIVLTMTAFTCGKSESKGEDGGKTAKGSMKWTAVSNHPFTSEGVIREIAYGGGKFVVVGEDSQGGKIAYSSNGTSWKAVTDSKFGNEGIEAIVYGKDKFVAGGGGGKMAYSSDGINWTAIADSKFGSSTIFLIAYGNNKFVATGAGGKMAYSSDGINWTTVADYKFGTSNNVIDAIAYGNNKFVAVGDNGKMATSSDGIVWTAVADSKFGTTQINAITWGNNRFVAAGDGGKMAYSADGITWTAVPDGKFGTSDNSIKGIAFGNDKFVAVGQKGKMVYSGSGGASVSVNTSLDGVWAMNGVDPVITINGSTGIITSMKPSSGRWLDAMNKSHVKIGDQYWRNIKSSGSLKWSGQVLIVTFNTSSPNVSTGTNWRDMTITMNADGQTITISSSDTSGNTTAVYTRQK